MLKKTISAIIALILIFSAMPSCSDIPSEDSTQEISPASPETSEIVTEEPVLHSFSAREVSFNNDPFDDYLCFLPEKGSEGSESWGRIYVTGSIGKELLPYVNEGEYATVTYSGEIEPLADSEYGSINNVHSVTIKNDPRQYGGKNFGVAIMRQNFYWEQISLSAGSANAGSGKLIMSSHEEFTKLMEEHILYQHPIPEDATDFAKMFATRFNNRIHLISDYDEEFFSDFDILMIFKRTGSGGSRFDVTDISVDSGICTVTIDFTKSGDTNDVGQWIVLISIPKEVSTTIAEYKTFTQTPEW